MYIGYCTRRRFPLSDDAVTHTHSYDSFGREVAEAVEALQIVTWRREGEGDGLHLREDLCGVTYSDLI